uniref:Toll/interleukin-1 receptor (TIR) domain-containing protein n=1 Tax=Tanacetum cinerariifolium TaxID=118510 RepID=A0A6L2N5D5_TANCI|nr:Toll/interleukin-1 receptor (TIR) domain-containing protein [Tanacetum cinerariifolium]
MDIRCLGWTDIHYVKDSEVDIINLLVDVEPKKHPVKMVYEFGIFSTYFPGKEVPKWFAYRSNRSSISFTMPSSSANKRIQGINICFVHTFSALLMSYIHIEVTNITKDRSWTYFGYMGAIGYADKDIVWLSHWMFWNNELEAGDEVSITILDQMEQGHGSAMVTECGISFVYSDRDKESVDHPLSYYKLWKHIIGRDLSAFENTSGGYYYLSNNKVCPGPLEFKRLFHSETRYKKSFDRIITKILHIVYTQTSLDIEVGDLDPENAPLVDQSSTYKRLIVLGGHKIDFNIEHPPTLSTSSLLRLFRQSGMESIGLQSRNKLFNFDMLVKSTGKDSLDILLFVRDKVTSEDGKEICKELFKHIACFFVGKESEVTEAILKDSINHMSDGIKKLVERCLLTIGVGEELIMHQLVQDMGRDIVRQESPDKPWKRSRVWNHEESLNILLEDKGTAKIQGLFFDMKMLEKESCGSSSAIDHEFQDNDLNMNFGAAPSFSRLLEFSSSHCRKIKFSTNALNKMEKLILLQLNHAKLNGPYKNFPKGLRGLCMHGFQSEYIPSDLQMEHLVALDMSFSDLKQLWRTPKVLNSSILLV